MHTNHFERSQHTSPQKATQMNVAFMTIRQMRMDAKKFITYEFVQIAEV